MRATLKPNVHMFTRTTPEEIQAIYLPIHAHIKPRYLLWRDFCFQPYLSQSGCVTGVSHSHWTDLTT